MNKIILSFVFGLVLATVALAQERQYRPDATRSVTRELSRTTTITNSRLHTGRYVTGITRQVGSQRITTWSDGARTVTRSIGRSRVTNFKKK